MVAIVKLAKQLNCGSFYLKTRIADMGYWELVEPVKVANGNRYLLSIPEDIVEQVKTNIYVGRKLRGGEVAEGKIAVCQCGRMLGMSLTRVCGQLQKYGLWGYVERGLNGLYIIPVETFEELKKRLEDC